MARGAKNLDDLAQNFWELLWVYLAVGLVIAIGLWVVFKLRSRLRDDEGSATGHHVMLAQLRDLHRQGELSEEEYRSIKGRLVKKLDGSLSAPQPDDGKAAASHLTGAEDDAPAHGTIQTDDDGEDAVR